MTLYAQWSLKNSTHYAVHFNANGGSGTMFDQAIAVGESAALTTCAFTRTGYSFAGWTTEADGSGATTYTDGATVSGLTSAGQIVNLYAQWTQNNYNITIDGTSNGKVNAKVGETENATTALYNDTVTLTVTPDPGYALDSLSVK